MGLIWETGPGSFLVLTILLGGGAAYAMGRAIAQTWKPLLLLLFYGFLIALGVRFLHFALYGGTLLSPYYFAIDYIVVLAFAGLGFRLKRVSQMVTQYSWIYERAGSFFWKER